MKPLKLIAAVSAVILLPLTASVTFAATDHTDKHHVTTPAAAKAASDSTNMAEAEVRKVDKDAKKITLKHGEIKNLEMPAMTMIFQTKDTALLNKVKVGDKVKFKAEKVTSGYAVTEIEVVQ